MTFPSTSFHYFVQLPPELRLRIWAYALPAPRIIELTWTSHARSVTSKSTTPAILHACQESRYHTAPFYKEVQFGTCTQVTLVDFERDTIFLGPGCRHLVPSGKCHPWVMQNRKVIRDIKSSISLRENLSLVAFDCEFLLGLEESERERSLGGILDVMDMLKQVVVVKTVDGKIAMGGVMEPVVSDERMDLCISRLEAYQGGREGRAKLVLSKAMYNSMKA